MRDRFAKTPSTLANNNQTGGANTHTHAASASHSHSATSTHTHTVSSFGAATEFTGGSPSQTNALREHTHTVSTVGSATTTWNSTTITADSSSNQPEYKTVAYIQATNAALGGGGASIIPSII